MPIFTPQLAGNAGFDLDAFSDLNPSDFPVISDAGSLATNEGWHVEQLGALDMGQRVITTLLGKNTGVPTLAGQLTQQLKFLGVPPAVLSDSPITSEFVGLVARGVGFDEALSKALETISKVGFDALQGAVGAAADIAGSFPIAGWIVDIVRAAVELGLLINDAMSPKDWKALKVARPVYDPGEDYNATGIATRASATRDWTGLFSPAPADYPLATTDPFTFGPVGMTKYPNFAGRKTEGKGEWIFAQWGGTMDGWFFVQPNTSAHWGFVPTWGRHGGRLWRGCLVDKDKKTQLVGDMIPTAQSSGLAMWRAVQNPYAPQIFFVDARALGNRWLNYLVRLRQALHMSHEKAAFQALKDLKGEVYGQGTVQHRLWLSLATIDDGNLQKKIDRRRAIVNRLVDVFGWPPWNGSDEEKCVKKYDDIILRSDDEYIERYRLNDATPVVACRELFARQIQATQSVTVLYSRDDDPAFANDPAMRELRRSSISAALVARRKIGLVDRDMIQENLIADQATQLEQSQGTQEAISRAQKSATFEIPAVWTGEGVAPGKWAGIDPVGSGGGGGLLVGGAVLAVLLALR